jgi:hypothetical protein
MDRYRRLDLASRIGSFSHGDIPKFVLNEEVLRPMEPVMEIVRIELAESERRGFGKSESGKRGCVGQCD